MQNQQLDIEKDSTIPKLATCPHMFVMFVMCPANLAVLLYV